MYKTKKGTEEIFEIWVKSKRSDRTQDSYKRVVPQFMLLMTGKPMNEIDKYDLLGITPASVQEKYLDEMRRLGHKDSTIKNYLDVVSSFITYLEANNVFDINYKFITEIALEGKSLKDDSSRRGLMTKEEYDNLKTWLLEREFSKRYGNLGEKYAIVLELMWGTAIRIDSIFKNITWNDIVWEEDSSGNEGWTIYALDKGDKVNRKPISEILYNKIRDVLYQGKDDDSILKGLSKQSFTRLLSEYSEEFGVKVTPHSIKVGAGTALYAQTKDIVVTSRFLDHADTKTTERYIRTENDRTNTGSYIMTTPIDVSQIYGLSLPELQDILINRADLGRAVLLEAQKNNLI